jgi:hypothetical protein
LPTFTPGACFGMLVCKTYKVGRELTPLVVMGSERGTREWNSPWLLTASGFLLADMLGFDNSLT